MPRRPYGTRETRVYDMTYRGVNAPVHLVNDQTRELVFNWLEFSVQQPPTQQLNVSVGRTPSGQRQTTEQIVRHLDRQTDRHTHRQTDTHTHTHPFNSPFFGTTQVSQYQKGKTNLDFTEARDTEWQWHQLLGHIQVCTWLQTDNHASTPPLSF